QTPRSQSQLTAEVTALLLETAAGRPVDVRRLQASMAELRGRFGEEAASEVLGLSQTLNVRYLEWQKARSIRKSLAYPDIAATSAVASTIKRAYWDKHKEDMERRDFSFVYERVKEFVQVVKGYIPLSRHQQIDAMIDFPLLKQQIDHSAVDWSTLLDIIGRMVAMLGLIESPASHEATLHMFRLLNEGKDLKDFTAVSPRSSPRPFATTPFTDRTVDALEFLFAQLDVLQRELFQFKRAACCSAEREAFEKLADLTDLKQMRLFATQSAMNTKELLISIIANVDQTTAHECMQLDNSEFFKLRNSFACLERLAVLLVAAESLGLKNKSIDFTQKLWNMLISGKSQEETILDACPDQHAAFKAAVTSAFERTSSLSKVFRQRVIEAILNQDGKVRETPKSLAFLNQRINE
ncbi:hypothetical protein EBZ37_13470, partial [bacterium]|nr:hypothetical protein [bacterium]